MTTIEIIVLVVGVFLFAGVLGFAFSQGGEEVAEVETFTEYTAEEQANIKAAEEAYNKPVADIKVNEPEFVPVKDEAPVVVELQVEPAKPKAKKKYPKKKKPKVQE